MHAIFEHGAVTLGATSGEPGAISQNAGGLVWMEPNGTEWNGAERSGTASECTELETL